ncbi:PREDICTED: AAA-ATPase At2g18190-like [Prunus mume]|uniref:AAA-ATPase At2g18190-like n=1 Tax=Prunus mume TaxID=102107 RepID=A0ABM0PMH6_PRUMU|nr:PREDICTED: AAA-ATPase At2g18190-like [Prunus mume]
MFSLNDLKDQMPTTPSALLSAYASFTAFMMLVRSMANELIPAPLRSYIYKAINYIFAPFFSVEFTLLIDQYFGMTRNQVYDAAEVYLRTKIGPSTVRLRVGKTPRKKTIGVTIDEDEEVTDTFDNVKLRWRFLVETKKLGKSDMTSTKRFFELTFCKKHKDKVLKAYLPFVLAQADAIKAEEKVVKLYTRHYRSRSDEDDDGCSEWGSVNLEHPSTFETMALDTELKRTIIEDLEMFVRRREFYKKVGKAWKRGYLLYGPPGTGKSSLIAAMANYLKFNVYDLELASIYSDAVLKRVLLSTTNRSILVIEDIDCCRVDVGNRASDSDSDSDSDDQVTLSGLLNFIDGLWSSCGDERIIVFTTNHKDRLDPALLRPGRMDVHIHLSYCTTSGFRILASNYLGIGDNNRHHRCGEIEGLIESTEVTPAEVAEELMKSEDADVALQGLVNLLKRKKAESEKKKLLIKNKKPRGRKGITKLLRFIFPAMHSDA